MNDGEDNAGAQPTSVARSSPPKEGTAPPARGAGYIPIRQAGSVRRTQSIDIGWPEGEARPARLIARSRDVRTAPDGAGFKLLNEIEIDALMSPKRDILSPTSNVGDARIETLGGVNAVAKFRARLRELYPRRAEREAGLYLLLDDIPGAVFVSNWAWHCWQGVGKAVATDEAVSETATSMSGVCIGLAAGSKALGPNGFPDLTRQSSAIVADVRNPDDPDGWHALPPATGYAGSRRCRWLDVSREGANIVAVAGFQDSAIQPDGHRRAVHEYRARAQMDREGRILEIDALPYILPYMSCPAASNAVGALAGRHISALRDEVPVLFAREAGCTHLNDVLRSLSSLPSLTSHLHSRTSGAPL